MKNFITTIAFIGLILTGNFGFSSETYENQEAKFKITFPTEYDVEKEAKEDMTVISLSATYDSMILLVSAFIYDDVIPEDEYGTKEAEAIVYTADAFNSKFKLKAVKSWSVGSEVGLVNPIKGKVPDGSGGKITFIGNIYVIMAGGVEFRITALATSKKGFSTSIESRFVNSFKLL
jgi:hypothetical protein